VSTTVELKVRFNEESQDIEVVAASAKGEEVLGVVERDIWSQWPLKADDKEKPEAPAEEPETPEEEPEAPAEEPETPAEEPEKPAEEPKK
jgi:hypothetical protein